MGRILLAVMVIRCYFVSGVGPFGQGDNLVGVVEQILLGIDL